MSQTRSLFLLAVLGVGALVAIAQQPKGPDTPPQRSPESSGRHLYLAYCASCHGEDGKGDGPEAPALRAHPSDLTILAQQNQGKFPYRQVYLTIKSEAELASHGSKDMPVWGPIFLAQQGGGDPAEVEQRIHYLTKYIQSLQSDLEASKPAPPRRAGGGS